MRKCNHKVQHHVGLRCSFHVTSYIQTCISYKTKNYMSVMNIFCNVLSPCKLLHIINSGYPKGLAIIMNPLLC